MVTREDRSVGFNRRLFVRAGLAMMLALCLLLYFWNGDCNINPRFNDRRYPLVSLLAVDEPLVISMPAIGVNDTVEPGTDRFEDLLTILDKTFKTASDPRYARRKWKTHAAFRAGISQNGELKFTVWIAGFVDIPIEHGASELCTLDDVVYTRLKRYYEDKVPSPRPHDENGGE